MKVLHDLNVLLDVVQNRVPHYRDSAEVLSRARTGEIQALIPAHAVTTIHYVLAKAAGRPKADQTVDWLLAHFEIAPVGQDAFLRAREMAFTDFEDAVVAGSRRLPHGLPRPAHGGSEAGGRRPHAGH